VLAGVLLPSATVFLLLLCNDSEVLGPWVNGRATNIFACGVVAVLIMLSVILTLSVIFGRVSSGLIIAIMAGFAAALVLVAGCLLARGWRTRRSQVREGRGREGRVREGRVRRDRSRDAGADRAVRENWRMPPLAVLAPVQMSLPRRIGMSAMWIYLGLAIALVVVRVVELALGH
jgi:hypothetical protein